MLLVHIFVSSWICAIIIKISFLRVIHCWVRNSTSHQSVACSACRIHYSLLISSALLRRPSHIFNNIVHFFKFCSCDSKTGVRLSHTMIGSLSGSHCSLRRVVRLDVHPPVSAEKSLSFEEEEFEELERKYLFPPEWPKKFAFEDLDTRHLSFDWYIFLHRRGRHLY